MKKLLKAFSESIWTFKDRYFLVEPVSDKAKESVYRWEIDIDASGVSVLYEHGRMTRRAFMKFLFSWSDDHFSRSTDDYLTNPTEMSDQDKESYKVLEKFVDGFAPAQCVTRAGEVILEEDGTPIVESRYISTAKLLGCSSHREAMELLGICYLIIFCARYPFCSLFMFVLLFPLLIYARMFLQEKCLPHMSDW